VRRHAFLLPLVEEDCALLRAGEVIPATGLEEAEQCCGGGLVGVTGWAEFEAYRLSEGFSLGHAGGADELSVAP
jgi:hypothetical protein